MSTPYDINLVYFVDNASMARDKYPSDKLDQFNLRLPPELKERLRKEAKYYGRSMNTEIVQRLQSTFLYFQDDSQINKSFKKLSIEQSWIVETLYEANHHADLALEILIRHLAGDGEIRGLVEQAIEANDAQTGVSQMSKDPKRMEGE